MIDVRLTATNPEDSTLVPVPCNTRGELLTVAPKIEKIPNDVEIEGDLTVTGLINGSDGVGQQGPPGADGQDGQDGKDGEPGGVGPQGPQGDPGEGVPLPYGPDGAYLRIVGGVPAWGDNTDPEPPPPPEPVIWTNVQESGGLKDLTGSSVEPPNPFEWVSSRSSWLNNDNYTTEGTNVSRQCETGSPGSPVFEFNDVFGKIITILINVDYTKDRDKAYAWRRECTWDTTDIAFISVNGPDTTDQAQAGTFYAKWEFSFMFSRQTTSASLGWNIYATGVDKYNTHFRGWILEDQGTFALRRQLALEKEFKHLRGLTTDIDKQSQT
jgi:hypothetical protein